jgi:hypothetical protein
MIVWDQSTAGQVAVLVTEAHSQLPRPQAAPSKLSSAKTEAALALLAQHNRALVALRAGGCLVNAVKPEMLLDAESLDLVLTARVAQAATPAAAQAVEDAWAELEVSGPGSGPASANLGRDSWPSLKHGAVCCGRGLLPAAVSACEAMHACGSIRLMLA